MTSIENAAAAEAVTSADSTRPSPTRTGNIVGVAYGLVALASSAAAVVVPAIRDDFDVSLATGAWVITAFIVSLAASAPIYGRIADHIGPRTPVTIGLVILSLGAVLSAFAPSIGTLIAARALLGLGAGSMPVLAPVIIALNTSEEERPHVLTRMSGIVAASSSGLLIGALLSEFLGWRPALALPALGLLLIGPVRKLTTPSTGSLKGVDRFGAAGVALIAVGLNVSLQLFANVGVGLIGIAILALGIAASVLGARRSDQQFLPPSVLRRSLTWRIPLAGSAIPATYFSLLIIVPAVLTEQHGLGRITIGALLFPSAFIGIIVGPIAARLRNYLSTSQMAATGLALASVSMFGTAFLLDHPIGIAIAFAVLAIAFGIGQGALLGLLSLGTPPDEQGAALAVFMVVFFLGGGIGGTLLTILGESLSLGTSLAIMATVPVIGALSILTLRP